jgi:hypothetical protein
MTESAREVAPKCGHKCHIGLGLNPWVDACPICGCVNPKYDPKAKIPDWAMGLQAYREDNP